MRADGRTGGQDATPTGTLEDPAMEFLAEMGWLNLALGIGLIFAFCLGLAGGLTTEAFRMLSAGLAVYAGVYTHEWLGYAIREHVSGPAVSIPPLSVYLFTLIVAYLLLLMVVSEAWTRRRRIRPAPASRLLGALVGVSGACLMTGAILMGIAVYPPTHGDENLRRSRLAVVLLESMGPVIRGTPAGFRERYRESVERVRALPAPPATIPEAESPSAAPPVAPPPPPDRSRRDS